MNKFEGPQASSVPKGTIVPSLEILCDCGMRVVIQDLKREDTLALYHKIMEAHATTISPEQSHWGKVREALLEYGEADRIFQESPDAGSLDSQEGIRMCSSLDYQ